MSDHSPQAAEAHHVISLQAHLVVFAILMALLVITVAVAYVDLGEMNTVVALTIAVIKMVLIMLYFMHLRYGHRLVWLFSGAAFLWLTILIAFALADYLTRLWLSIEGK